MGITLSLTSTSGSLRFIPWLVPSLCQPSRANCTRQAGLRGRGRGNKGSPGCCGAPWINNAPFPGRDYNRERQSLISGEVRSSGSCMDKHSMGNQHLHPIQLLLPSASMAQRSCLLPHRQRNSGEGRAQKYPGMSQKDPCTSLHLRVQPAAPGSSSHLLPHSQSTCSFAWVICVKNKLS